MWCKPHPDKLCVLTDMPSPTNIKEIQLFIGIMIYLDTVPTSHSRSLWTSMKTNISKGRLMHKVLQWGKTIIHWNWPYGWDTTQQNIEPDRACLSQKEGYRNVKREALRILHGLKEFHQYCFTREAILSWTRTHLLLSLRKMLQHCYKGYNAYYSEYIST